MSTLTCPREQAATQIVPAAVHAAVETTFSALWGEKPVPSQKAGELASASALAAIISFTGDIGWSLSLIVTTDYAPGMVKAFTFMDIPFDSPDMGDAIAELVNILAGDVVLQMDKRRKKAVMGLPVIARGCPLTLMPPKNSKAICLEYTSKYGPFGITVVAPDA